MLYKVNVCPQETLTESQILLMVNFPWYIRACSRLRWDTICSGHENIRWWGGKEVWNLLLVKTDKLYPRTGGLAPRIAGLRNGAEITSVGTIPFTRVGILCTRVSIHSYSTLNISPKLCQSLLERDVAFWLIIIKQTIHITASTPSKD